MNAVLERLLDAHVRHELALWQGAPLRQAVDAAVQRLFAWLESVTLDDVATREQITGVIERYVIELRVSGGITELTGELASQVLRSPHSAVTRVDDILTQASYEEFADKLMGLDSVHRELIALVARSMSFAGINAHMFTRSLIDVLARPLLSRPGRLARGLSRLLGPLPQRLAEGGERRLSGWIEQYLEQHQARVTHQLEQRLLQVLSPQRVRWLFDEVWEAVAGMRLSEAFGFLGEQDLEDFVVLIHEFWLRYRKTDFFRGVSAELVDHFFRKYGAQTLAELVDDMGVTSAMVSAELSDFLLPVTQHMLRDGSLEAALRARLADFYTSSGASAALQVEDLERSASRDPLD